MGTLSAWIDAVPPEFCSQEEKHAVAHLLANLPPCSRDIGLEADLGHPGNLYAVGLAITRDDERTSALLPTGRDLRLHKLALRSATWRRLSVFVLAWLHLQARSLGPRVPFVFLEFDRAPTWQNAPCIFMALDWPLAELEPQFRQQAPFAVPGFQVVLQLLTLLGDRAAGEQAHCLARCWRQLPEGGVWSHVGVLTSRPQVGRRVSLLLPRGSVATYLERVAPAVDSGPIVQLLERYGAVCHFDRVGKRVQLELDVGEHVSAKVGLSLVPKQPEGWRPLLDALVRDGLCEPRCATAALSWEEGAIRPLAGGRGLVPYLSHAKLVVHGERAMVPKLYLGLRDPRHC